NSANPSQNQPQATRGESSSPLLDVLICLTSRDPKEVGAPHELFEILSQLRAKASVAHKGGVYVDRRGVNE
ncbi:MAG TPA: hypothetical protein PKM22_15440, partial [Candidatus Hydrogenedentes bacterium]|nr:hypothetical protein [Candidatus Hydrogenedentota bacterium]